MYNVYMYVYVLFWILSHSFDLLQSCETKPATESLGSRLLCKCLTEFLLQSFALRLKFLQVAVTLLFGLTSLTHCPQCVLSLRPSLLL